MLVTLKNIKHIKELSFNIPKPGVWLLTGLNGSGKTSLLAALHRIGSSYAFQNFYKTSVTEKSLDSFSNASVVYSIGDEEVSYRYGGQRWRPTPNKNAKLLEKYPYKTVPFIYADAKRIEPSKEEIRTARHKKADDALIAFMTYVLDSNKWKDLKIVNTKRGVGNQAYLIQYKVAGLNHYFSEKNFSLGELGVLRLASQLIEIENNSLVLIDEIEMALHPQAQSRLLKKIQEIASEKDLTVIFSTHSSTLIKQCPRKNIIFIENQEKGIYKSIQNVYPARVLGNVAYDDELHVDLIFFVEDDQAKYLLEQMLIFLFKLDLNEVVQKPAYRVVPVGGITQVLDLLIASKQFLPSYVNRYAFLDQDAKQADLSNYHDKLESKKINFLPITPEQGIVHLIENDNDFRCNLSLCIQGCQLNITQFIYENGYKELKSDNPRTLSKYKFLYILDRVVACSGTQDIIATQNMYAEFVKHTYQCNDGGLKKLLLPVINNSVSQII